MLGKAHLHGKGVHLDAAAAETFLHLAVDGTHDHDALCCPGGGFRGEFACVLASVCFRRQMETSAQHATLQL